jgi:hypothetical protein
MTMRYSHLATHDLDVCVPILERAVDHKPSAPKSKEPAQDGKPEESSHRRRKS